MKIKKTNEQILNAGATFQDKTQKRAHKLALKFTAILLRVFRVSPAARLELAQDWAFAANHMISTLRTEHPELFVQKNVSQNIGGDK
jgi:hypothetical protein